MAGVQVVAIAAEGLGEAANQLGTDTCHFNRPPTFGHQAAHSGLVLGVGIDQAEQAHGGADVDEGPVVRDPIADGRAKGDELTGAAPDAVPRRAGPAADAQLVEGPQDAGLKPV